MKKGLLVFVYTSPQIGDCTANGISRYNTTLILIGEGVPEISEGTEYNTVVLKKKYVAGEYLYCVPFKQPKGLNGPMMGGNFIYSCDSRFREICKYPIPIHDRFEQWI